MKTIIIEISKNLEHIQDIEKFYSNSMEEFKKMAKTETSKNKKDIVAINYKIIYLVNKISKKKINKKNGFMLPKNFNIEDIVGKTNPLDFCFIFQSSDLLNNNKDFEFKYALDNMPQKIKNTFSYFSSGIQQFGIQEAISDYIYRTEKYWYKFN